MKKTPRPEKAFMALSRRTWLASSFTHPRSSSLILRQMIILALNLYSPSLDILNDLRYQAFDKVSVPGRGKVNMSVCPCFACI